MERSYLPTISGYIHRPRMDALITKGLEYSLVLVVAGPGYGKTLSLAHYMQEADVRLVWVRASNIRTRAADFWDDMVKAAARELPEYAEKLEELGFPESPVNFEGFRELATQVAQAGKRLVLVVDSYERILDKGIVQFLNRLVDSELPNFTMYILCNTMLPFADVLPATGQLRITDENLAFTVEEAGMMFEQYGAGASAEAAVKATGGWPLGLRLVCESRSENPEDYSSRSPVQVAADLFELHYFRNYPRDVKAQLVLFSLLPQFSADMARFEMETPRDAFATFLMHHPFISYDYGNGLYLYQPMYHDFLRGRQSLLSMESRIDTMDFAGRWFLGRGMVNEAMDCFWEAADYDGYLEAVGALPKVRMPVAITDRILDRLEQIPRGYADNHLVVKFSIAFMHLNAANMHKARELLIEVASLLESQADSEERRGMLGDTYAALADIATYLNEDTGLAWMKKAYEQVPDGTHAHSPELLSLGNNTVFFLPNNDAGQLEHMVEYFFEYTRYSDAVKNGCGYGYDYLFAGEAAYYREEMDKAAALFNSALLKAHRTRQHDIICNAFCNLGRIELYYGNHKNALAMLGEMEQYVEDNRLVGMHELRDCIIAYFYVRLGDVDKIPKWFGDTMQGPESIPITVARKQITSAYYLRAKGESAKAFAVLMPLEALVEKEGRWTERFCLRVLKASHYMATGDPVRFEREFHKAYDMVYANNLRLCLSGYGKEVMLLIDNLKKQDTSAYDMAWLDEVHDDATSVAKRLQMMRTAYKGGEKGRRSSISLTKRENETLHYLAQGLTQKEIGKLMGISENAVKKHISKIYFKLGAVNRADAIHIATVNGLVDVINN